MRVEDLIAVLDSDFYTGVPDSQLKPFCDYLLNTFGTDKEHHIIAANEGNAVALAAGYHLATGETPVVYMQNSGEGNIINPVASLLSPEVYAIPCVFIIGWRGEPNVHDEPQHIYQGKVTCELLDVMDISYFVLDKDVSFDDVKRKMAEFREDLKLGKSVAFVVKKGALEYEWAGVSSGVGGSNVAGRDDDCGDDHMGFSGRSGEKLMSREEAIEHIIKFTGDDPIVSTTGKASRELFELRERCDNGESKHARDFLTVGSMGHCSSIALGISIHKPDARVWCIDGDGAALMHMGAMAVIGEYAADNLVHIVINNGAHDTVGGQPTVMANHSLVGVAKELGYGRCYFAEDIDGLDNILSDIIGTDGDEDRSEKGSSSGKGPVFVEILCRTGARDDLGRPTTTAVENKTGFMKHIK